MKRMINSKKTWLTLALLVAMSGCTLNEGDPQTTLCQKLTAHLMTADNVQWGEVSKVAGADKSMNVTIHWESTDDKGTLPMQASCIYLSDENDAGEDYDVNVTDDYQSVPDSMVINGQPVRIQDLYTAIQKVTGQSIRDTASKEHLQKKAAEVDQAIQEGAAKADQALRQGAAAIKEGSNELRQKAGEALQKAGEHLKK